MNTIEPTQQWRNEPPDEEGLWWLYGDEEFGTMGGNYTGFFPPNIELQVIDVRQITNGLIGVCGGRIISLTPFNEEQRQTGFIGVWQKVNLPTLPKP